MFADKMKDMELSKLCFMGFVPAQKRIALLEPHIADLKKEGEQLERIQKQDEFANKLEYIACMEKNPEQKGRLLLVTGHGETDF